MCFLQPGQSRVLCHFTAGEKARFAFSKASKGVRTSRCCGRAGQEQHRDAQKQAEMGRLHQAHRVCLGLDAETSQPIEAEPCPIVLSPALAAREDTEQDLPPTCTLKTKHQEHHTQLALPCAIRAIAPHQQPPAVILPLPRRAAWQGGKSKHRVVMKYLSRSLQSCISGNEMHWQAFAMDAV